MPFHDSSSHSVPLVRKPNATERFLRRIFLQDWNLKLLALAVTLGLWFAVNGQRAPITERFSNVPLNFQLPANMGISNDPPDQIELTLTGARRDLDFINPRDLTATIDVTDRRPGDRVVQLSPGRLKIELPTGVRLERIQPASVHVRLEPILERELEIEARLEGRLADGYEVSKVTITPQRVRVLGPSSHVNALTRAGTETILLDGRKDSFTLSRIAIDVPDQKVTMQDATVDVAIEIHPVKRSN